MRTSVLDLAIRSGKLNTAACIAGREAGKDTSIGRCLRRVKAHEIKTRRHLWSQWLETCQGLDRIQQAVESQETCDILADAICPDPIRHLAADAAMAYAANN
jgi:hypothetical protein